MRVLVYPRDLELGGSSINAVDLAAAMRARGHEMFVFGRPGPLADRIRALGLPWLPADVPERPRPSLRALRGVAAAVGRYRIDLVHTYEFWPCVEGFYGAAGRGVPVLGTVMTMGLAGYLPGSVPLTVGYRDLLDEARAQRRAPVHLLEPPVDTAVDHPGIDTSAFLERWKLDPTALTVVIVSRAAVLMKQEGIERTMDAVATLAAAQPRRRVQLVVVGGGSAFEMLRERADALNARAGHEMVILTGAMADPRPAYAVADVVAGMGSSVLRGMAFGTPAVVVGERGFSAPVRPETLPRFDRTGFYGVGDARPAAADDPLPDQIGRFLDDPADRAATGAFGAELVRTRFSLDAVGSTLADIYADAVATPSGRAVDAMGTGARIVAHKVTGRMRSRRAHA